MSDLISMIDDTTKRLLKKIDNWEIPQSDKKYVTIEKEVWESTLKASMDRAGKIETLQKQLEIAVKCLKQYANRDNWYNTYKPNSLDECPIASKERWKKEYGYKQAEKALEKIEEMN